MATIKIETEAGLNDLIQSGDIEDGALVRSGGHVWLAYDTEDGPYAVRPPSEDDPLKGPPYVPVLVQFEDFDLPMYITTQEN